MRRADLAEVRAGTSSDTAAVVVATVAVIKDAPSLCTDASTSSDTAVLAAAALVAVGEAASLRTGTSSDTAAAALAEVGSGCRRRPVSLYGY